MTLEKYRELMDNRPVRIERLRDQREPVFIDDKSIPVWFLGVWDTVGCLGYPDPVLGWINNDKYKYHIVKLTPNISIACHAVAIHELRQDFKPELWQTYYPHQQVAQVWFPGAHSDVGGGQDKDCLSNCSLKWMLNRAEEMGLEFDPTAVPYNLKRPIDISVDCLKWRSFGAQLRIEIGDTSKGIFQCAHDSVSRRISMYGPSKPNYPWEYRVELSEADRLSQDITRLPMVTDSTSIYAIKAVCATVASTVGRPSAKKSNLFIRALRRLF